MFLEALNPKRSGSSLPTPNHPNHPLLYQQPLKALSAPGGVIARDAGHIASGGSMTPRLQAFLCYLLPQRNWSWRNSDRYNFHCKIFPSMAKPVKDSALKRIQPIIVSGALTIIWWLEKTKYKVLHTSYNFQICFSGRIFILPIREVLGIESQK